MDLTGFVTRDRKRFTVDLIDISTGNSVCEVGDTITFLYNGQRKTAIVTDQLIGRNDDVAVLNIVG